MNWNSPITTSAVTRGANQGISSESLRKLYWDEKLPLHTIAEKFGVTPTTIYNIMCRNNIPRRSKSEGTLLGWERRLTKLLKPILSSEEIATLFIKGERKTHKFCWECLKLKPITEFYRNASAYDGLMPYCKKCMQEAHLMTTEKHYAGLHKRPFPLDAMCEICGKKLKQYCYHHWDDNNLSLGVWVCGACDYLSEGIDEIDKNPQKVDIYRRLKKEVEEVEKAYVYSGPYSPPDGTHRLFFNGKQTHRWCPHCGQMKPVGEFYRSISQYDGLQGCCKQCQLSSMLGYHAKKFIGLHKRPKPDYCELCGGIANLNYHHWDDTSMSKGVWVCGMSKNKCHELVEAVDKIDNGSSLPDKYITLKQEIIDEQYLATAK